MDPSSISISRGKCKVCWVKISNQPAPPCRGSWVKIEKELKCPQVIKNLRQRINILLKVLWTCSQNVVPKPQELRQKFDIQEKLKKRVNSFLITFEGWLHSYNWLKLTTFLWSLSILPIYLSLSCIVPRRTNHEIALIIKFDFCPSNENLLLKV